MALTCLGNLTCLDVTAGFEESSSSAFYLGWRELGFV